MYFNYTKYILIVFQLENTNYFCQDHKIQNTKYLNVFKIHVFQLILFQLLQHWQLGHPDLFYTVHRHFYLFPSC